MYEWIIVGGGIHGCTITNFLIKTGQYGTRDIRIIDRYKEPMTNWKKNTSLISMPYLRSPSVHHIDVDPFSLEKFAKESQCGDAFYGTYDRPSLHLFNDHCDTIFEEINIREMWIQGEVTQIKKKQFHWEIENRNGEIVKSKNIVLAISISDQPVIPKWGQLLFQESDNVFHVYDNLEVDKLKSMKYPVTIIGAGITAAHLAIKLSKNFPRNVTMLKRHPFRIHSFDSDPGWLGPKYLNFYDNMTDYEKRRNLIVDARNKGSIPRELYHQLRYLEKNKIINIQNGEVEKAEKKYQNIQMHLTNGERIATGSIIFATGFSPHLPKHNWLSKLINHENLRCAKCGYPVVTRSLQWCDHLYVSGPLAELEIGPVARNIAGARKAAERIVASISQ
ncbi:FAD-dependent oxidoreductase [Evansella cellulosilytica]|uniref:L-lysine N6-monooxygenase MbtG n=1 Tax=Evansella cellulosilytica (strain ATCC 21833 / DSM 2522 / FERM P-1141 / JCM 9156 / N-4) TaxID=649639 RepID=E6TQW0_EVAC2|nr:FAD/NAD(P)-binding protein [Evansella cellulosilytica]ADU31735.1 hypothetical protein Bcell_3493 [Evansella cellulosilytica DSM 2522]